MAVLTSVHGVCFRDYIFSQLHVSHPIYIDYSRCFHPILLFCLAWLLKWALTLRFRIGYFFPHQQWKVKHQWEARTWERQGSTNQQPKHLKQEWVLYTITKYSIYIDTSFCPVLKVCNYCGIFFLITHIRGVASSNQRFSFLTERFTEDEVDVLMYWSLYKYPSVIKTCQKLIGKR